MRDRAWCGEHDRSLEFATTDQERVCFSGLGNAETTCRIETANVTEALLARARSDVVALVDERKAAEARLAQIAETGSVEIHVDCEGCVENTAIARALVEAEERLAQIAELLVPPYGKTNLFEARRLARGEEPA